MAAESKTPDEFMRTAVLASDLTASDMKPWHLRAHYKQFKPDGTVNREGVFEEWWASSTAFKTVYTSPDSTHTEYRTTSGTFFTGSTDFAPGPVTEILLHPLPYPGMLDRLTFTSQEISVGNAKLRCYSGAMRDRARTYRPTAYCFSEALPVLRASEDSFGNRTTWNAIVAIHDRFVAKQVEQLNSQHQPTMNVEVEQIDAALGIDASALVPPVDAKPLPPRKITVSSGVMSKNKLAGNDPHYPFFASYAGVQGTVVIQATINPAGAVEQLHVVSGPGILQQPSIDAVKTWRYQPYLLNGEPVTVETTINVVFNIGPRAR